MECNHYLQGSIQSNEDLDLISNKCKHILQLPTNDLDTNQIYYRNTFAEMSIVPEINVAEIPDCRIYYLNQEMFKLGCVSFANVFSAEQLCELEELSDKISSEYESNKMMLLMHAPHSLFAKCLNILHNRGILDKNTINSVGFNIVDTIQLFDEDMIMINLFSECTAMLEKSKPLNIPLLRGCVLVSNKLTFTSHYTTYNINHGPLRRKCGNITFSTNVLQMVDLDGFVAEHDEDDDENIEMVLPSLAEHTRTLDICDCVNCDV